MVCRQQDRPREKSVGAGRTGCGVAFLRNRLMTFHIEFEPLIALIAGICVLIFPKLLNYIVAAYLILIGLTGFIY